MRKDKCLCKEHSKSAVVVNCQEERLKLCRDQFLLACFMHHVKYMVSLNNKNKEIFGIIFSNF